MIFRRRHTANYTTIGNALFDDERLAADELGILAWLLSRPDNWQVRRPALMRRHHVGRDALKRIITNWMRTGWCHAQKTRLLNGTFHIVYEIRDEPGRELTDDEIRTALSLVSSEAVTGDVEADDMADRHETGDPPTPQPGVDDQGVATRSWPIETLINTDSEKPESTNGVRAFSDVREVWPIENILSPVVCEAAHTRLVDADKEAALQGMRPYLAECRAKGRKICDLATFYRERRWERFAARQTTVGYFHLTRHTAAQTARWRQWYAENDPSRLAFFDKMLAGNGYTAPSEWPPPKTAQKSNPEDSPSLSPQDAEAFLNSTLK